jgi:hypothetical protein
MTSVRRTMKAAREVLIEQCAKIADDAVVKDNGRWPERTRDGEDWCYIEGGNRVAEEIARQIRALLGGAE